jgi:hypothetical protein
MLQGSKEGKGKKMLSTFAQKIDETIKTQIV